MHRWFSQRVNIMDVHIFHLSTKNAWSAKINFSMVCFYCQEQISLLCVL